MDPEEQTSDLYGIIQSVVHVEWLSTALTVAIALAFTALVARAVTKVLRRVLSHDNSPLPSSSIFVNIARIAVWAVGVSVVLSSCGDYRAWYRRHRHLARLPGHALEPDRRRAGEHHRARGAG